MLHWILQKETRGSGPVPAQEDKQQSHLCGLWCNGWHPRRYSQAFKQYGELKALKKVKQIILLIIITLCVYHQHPGAISPIAKLVLLKNQAGMWCFLNRFSVCFNLFVLLFLVTPYLVLAVQPCMEWIPIKRNGPLSTLFKRAS